VSPVTQATPVPKSIAAPLLDVRDTDESSRILNTLADIYQRRDAKALAAATAHEWYHVGTVPRKRPPTRSNSAY
jgi:hypothetical protein